jgi:hypothetical protein
LGNSRPTPSRTGTVSDANLGFRSPCADGKVKFQFSYQEGDGPVVPLREWSKSCDASLLFVEVDLSALAGKTVNFIIGVHADGSHEG